MVSDRPPITSLCGSSPHQPTERDRPLDNTWNRSVTPGPCDAFGRTYHGEYHVTYEAVTV